MGSTGAWSLHFHFTVIALTFSSVQTKMTLNQYMLNECINEFGNDTSFKGITITKNEGKHGTDEVISYFGGEIEIAFSIRTF